MPENLVNVYLTLSTMCHLIHGKQLVVPTGIVCSASLFIILYVRRTQMLNFNHLSLEMVALANI